MAHITINTAKETIETETSVVFAVIDNGERGTKQLVAIEDANPVEVTAAIGTLLDLVDTITERFPHYRIAAEAARHARDIEKEEEKKDG